jgi:hypothetical protein
MRTVGVQGLALPLMLLVAAGAGCAGAASEGVSSGTGSGGSGAYDCQTIDCVPTIFNTTVLAAEVTPPTGSGAAITEISSVVTGSGSPINLTTDIQASVAATFIAASGGTLPGNANVVLDVPSQIPGRPDLTFQAIAVASAPTSSGQATTTAQLSVPQMLSSNKGTNGTLSLLPLAPDDQQTPPYSKGVTLISTGLPAVTLPSDNLFLSGFLLDSVLHAPAVPFVARAFQGSTLVSNAPILPAYPSGDGSFQLVIPSAAAAPGKPQVTIQLTPQSPSDPWFILNSFQLPDPPVPQTSLGTFQLGAYTPVKKFNVLVVGMDSSAVSGAMVQAQTNLGGGSTETMPTYDGTTSFAQSGVTDANGTAALSLIPASGNYKGSYDVVAIPPPGSIWATTCLLGQKAQIPTNSGVSVPGAPSLGTVTLNPRPSLNGNVTDANGRGVAGVVIIARPRGDPTGNCKSTPAAQGTTTTDSGGSYLLPLDPGTYQLDYEPPLGSGVPRSTESGVSVAGTGIVRHDLQLPRAGKVVGKVVTASGDPLPTATVKLFQPQCSSSPCSTPPVLRGQAVTDSSGQFQIVVPVVP